MAIKVKDIAKSVEKWQARASAAAGLMAENAEAAADLWVRNAAGASENYGMAISAANIKARFRKGIEKAGAAKFARMIREKASARFSAGVSIGVDEYRSDVEPYFATLAALTLTARKPRGDPSNYRRVEEVGKALNAKRLAMLAVSS